ncbi:MAG: 4Fe-4S dicluster domain-containing protein [Syntrophales bacterium]|nr:4Fe-4S dicluster domain-containing protein [Syntrophales bacterium]
MPELRGGVIHNLGNTLFMKTGSWRTFKPVIDHDKCNRCIVCSDYCIEGVVYRKGKEEKIVIDYDYCKGCGVCAHECPLDAVEMVREEMP